MDVAIAIDNFAEDVTLTRTATGSYDQNGEYIPGAQTISTIRAAVFPIQGRERQDLPEGIREKAVYNIWSRYSLLNEDHITVNAEDFEICHTWPRHALGVFTKGVLGKLPT